MRKAIAVSVIALALAARAAGAGENDPVPKAQVAVQAWLALADAGEYSKSWDEASAVFRAAVTKPDWEKALRSVRSPLGALKSRKVRSATFTRSLPGAPDGEYVVFEFDTRFENKASAMERVTPMREKDGAWRVSGYYIR